LANLDFEQIAIVFPKNYSLTMFLEINSVAILEQANYLFLNIAQAICLLIVD